MTTSSDGFLTATVDASTASITLLTTFGSSYPTATTVTVTRSDGTIVRGMNLLSAPGGSGVGVDHEAPLGAAVVYTAQAIGPTGAVLHTSTTATATITALTSGAWLKSLTYPALSQLVTISKPIDWNYPITQGTFPIVGAASPTVISDVQQTPTGSLDIVTLTNSAQLGLQALLASAGPFFFQTIASDDDGDVYVSVGAVTMARPVRILQDPTRVFTLPLQVITRPSTVGSRVTKPGHSYANSTTTWALYSNRTGAYNTR